MYVGLCKKACACVSSFPQYSARDNTGPLVLGLQAGVGCKHWSYRGAVQSLNHRTISLGSAWLLAVLLLIYQIFVPAE